MTATADAPLPAAGWYPDPAGRAEHRWWNGSTWTTAVADGQTTRVDLHGLPISPPPGAGSTASSLAGPPRSRDKVRPWLLPVAASAIVLVLAVGLAIVIRHGDDRADADAAARKQLSQQFASLGSDVSSLSSQVGDLSKSSADALSSFSDFSSFSDASPSVDPCSVLKPEDVDAALGITVHVDHTFGAGFVCLMATDQTANGTAVIVRTDQLSGTARDLFGDLPGNVDVRPLVAGDEAYVATAYGSVMGVATKNGRYVEIQIETASALPTDDQVTALLVAAVARL